MAKYVIRVELNGRPSADTYKNLHAAMFRANAVRTIVGDDGVTYALPHATYIGTSTSEPPEVQEMMSSVVEPIWDDCDVCVFRYDSAAWKLSKA